MRVDQCVLHYYYYYVYLGKRFLCDGIELCSDRRADIFHAGAQWNVLSGLNMLPLCIM